MTDSQEFEPDTNPHPNGDLAIQTLALAANTNQYGDIFGGWLAAQMDLAASVACGKVARGKVATVAIDSIAFLSPVQVGSIVSCYTRVRGVGRSSIKVNVEAWVMPEAGNDEWTKVAEGRFIFVAIDGNGRTRAIPRPA
ncbi:MAG: acyl-CoA thioesterase [Pseudohongiellaceae bacterium]